MATSPEGFVLECYHPGVTHVAVDDDAERLRTSVTAMRSEGRDLEYVESILLPEDEVVFHLLNAEDPETASEAARRAGVAFDRVLRAVEVSGRLSTASPTTHEGGNP